MDSITKRCERRILMADASLCLGERTQGHRMGCVSSRNMLRCLFRFSEGVLSVLPESCFCLDLRDGAQSPGSLLCVMDVARKQDDFLESLSLTLEPGNDRTQDTLLLLICHALCCSCGAVKILSNDKDFS